MTFNRVQPYTITIQPDSDGIHEFVQVSQAHEIPDDVALCAGDTLHNLRTALDMLACVLALKVDPAVDIRLVEFPFGKSFNDFADARRQRKIQMLDADAIRWIAELEPYLGGDDLLHALHFLDVRDKHRTLLAIAPAPGEVTATIAGKKQRVPVQWRPLEKNMVIERRVIGTYPQNDLQFTLNIAFGDHPAVANIAIGSVLYDMTQKVKAIIADCERRFFP